MKHHPTIPLHGASLAASAALTAIALFAIAPVIRAQSPSPSEHEGSSDIFDVIKKGADKLQKQAKDAGKIEPQIKAIEARQEDFMKHQLEGEHQLIEVLMRQEAEIHRLADAVQGLQAEIKAARSFIPRPFPLPATPPAGTVPPPPAPAGSTAPLPATEPPMPGASPAPTPPRAFAAPTVM